MTAKKCNACGAPIVFIKTPGGGWMPCEKYPVPYQVNEDGSNPDTLVDSHGKTFREGGGEEKGRTGGAHLGTNNAALNPCAPAGASTI